MLTAVACASLLAVPATSAAGAANDSSSAKYDKNAVLLYGGGINDQGGVYFDPAKGIAKPVRAWMDLIYDTMIRQTPDRKGIPGLAVKWTTLDPATAEFTLRKGVTFSNGEPFTAAAVKAAWDRTRTSTTPNMPSEFLAISSIDAVGDDVVRVHFNGNFAQKFIDGAARDGQYTGVPAPAGIAAGNLNEKPIGAGPYMLEGYTPGQNFKLVRNPKFYDPKTQKLAGVEFIQVAPGTPSVAALQAHTVDLIWNLAPDPIPTIESTPGLAVVSFPGTRVNDIGLCATQGVFASKDARQAMQYAIDRKSINEAALDGVANPTDLVLTKTTPGYDASLDGTYKFDPKKAKALLKKAGVAPGTTIQALVATNPPQPAIAEIVQSNLKDVGLDMQITSTTNVSGDASRQPWDMNFVLALPSTLKLIFEPGAKAVNVCDYTNPEMSQALADANDTTKTPTDQKAAWSKLQKLLLDESPVIVSTDQPALAALTEETKGLTMIESPSGPVLYTVYKTK